MNTFRRTATALSLFAIVTATAPAQPAAPARTLVCATDDGTLTITPRTLQIRDYCFDVQSVSVDGVITLLDSRNGATAELDTRGTEGLYLVIRDEGATMQVIAPRLRMVERDADTPGTVDGASASVGNLILLAQRVPLLSAR